MSQVDLKQLVGGGARYLTFSLGAEEFAIPLLAVKEVIAVPELTPIPFSPEHFLGMMNLRSQVIPVIDLRQKLEVKPHSGKTETAVIICDIGAESLGVKVDSVNSVVTPSLAEISPKPEARGHRNSDFVLAVYRRGKALILLLDIAKVLDANDRQALELSTHSTNAA